MGKTIAMMVAVAALSACEPYPGVSGPRDIQIWNDYAESCFRISIQLEGQTEVKQLGTGGCIPTNETKVYARDAIPETAKKVTIYLSSTSVGQNFTFPPKELALDKPGHVRIHYRLNLATMNFETSYELTTDE